MTPPDLEAELAMPGGNIFHGDLSWPWAETEAEVGTWGVETDLANVFIGGSGARRGGAVSGIGGHNAAMAVLQRGGFTGQPTPLPAVIERLSAVSSGQRLRAAWRRWSGCPQRKAGQRGGPA